MKSLSRRFFGTAARRRTSLVLSTVMLGSLLQAVAMPTAAIPEATAADSNRPGLPEPEKPVPGTDGIKVKPRTLEKGPRTPSKAPRSNWPKAGTEMLSVPDAPARGAGSPVRAKSLPIGITAAESPGKAGAKKTEAAGPDRVEARVFGRKEVERAGVKGLLFSLASKDGAGQVAVTVDYADFAESFGGGYAARLRLVELPACALTTPEKDACRTGEPVASTNDTEKQTLTARSLKLSSGETTVLAAVADTEGDKGDYKATPLSPSAAWETNLNTGDFIWAYGMPAPNVPGGLVPDVGLSYSSDTIDGRTGGTNNQASWIGDGFDLSPGFIERRYKPCADDGVKNADGNKPGDLCWAYDNAFISFNGKGGELVPAGNNQWKFKLDDGTRIDRLTSSDRGNGDDNGEYWRLTAPDGIRYYFGYHRLPGWTTGKETTDSTWTVPVFGNDSGEPCHASSFANSWCQQAWRWNLDYVVDTHGNAIAYHYAKETNSYGRNLKAEDNTPYTRGGYLKRIDYGLRSSAMFDKPSAQVVFTNAERCLPQTGVTCAPDTIDDKAFYWYDTPWDLNCKAGTKCDKGRLSPSFWTRKRLTEVTTQVLKPDGTYGKVDSWKLAHRWGMADTDYQLLLESVQRTGHTATPAVTLPKTTFAYTQLANRLDRIGDGYAPFVKERLSTIADEAGGQIDANYSAPACNASALPTPQSNTTRCFPQYIGGDSNSDPERQWFNKYVVTSVTATDRTGGAPNQKTIYEYLGGAAWHFDDDDGLTKEKHKTWSQWRGYGHVRAKTGGDGGDEVMKSQQDHYFLRGMHGDRATPTGGTKTVSVTLGAGEGDPITDHESAAGFEYKTVAFDKPGGKVLEKSVHRPWHHQTARKARDWGTVTANFTGTSNSRSWTSLDDGAGTDWRTTSVTNSHDTVAGRVVQVDDRGDTSTSADNRCTRTTYATNTADTGANLLNLPSRTETVAKACDATVDRTKDVIEDVRTAYDGLAYGAAPTKGDPTAVATLKSHDGTKATYLEAGATYDSYGRELTVTDLSANVTVTGDAAPVRTVRTDGRTTTAAYTPATGLPTQIKTTTPPAKPQDPASAQTTTVDLEPLRGQPLKQTDTNDKVTEFAYDALGRSTKVWLADRHTTDTPTYEFAYTVTEGKPVAVATMRLNNNDGQITSYTLYDGFLRERQNQVPGPDGGRILTDVFYDERGLATKTFAPYYTTGAPSGTLFKPDDALSVETQTHTAFDGLGREIETRQIGGSGGGGEVLGITRTIHGGDRTTVIPPVGGTATTTLVDARGQTTELRQHHQRTATAAYDTTRYEHTTRGELAKVTDPAGNTWRYTYDQLGRKVRDEDPDKGATAYTHDDRGQLTSTTDARDVTLVSVYDGLGRRTELREGSTAGPLRAKWVYDTLTGAKGHLAESIRYVDGEAYTTRVNQYDRLYRATRTAVVIPQSEGALAGTYQTGTVYKPSGLIDAINYSAAGSLPGGTVSYSYEEKTLRRISVYGQGMTSNLSYSLTGKPLQYELGLASGGRKTIIANTYERGTQRLATSRVDRQDQSGVDRHVTYRYDEIGNVLSMADVSRTGTDNQCFTYDYLRRLTQAWTQATSTCADAPAGDKVGGPAPYWHSYTYDKVGNRLTETRHHTGGDSSKDVRRTYAYPEPGTPQAHTLSSLTTSGPEGTSTAGYTYDETGNTTARPGQKLTWDAEGRLAKVTEGSKVTEYVYDTEGNRLLGRTDTETTLYLGHTEVTLPKGASKAKATRYFALGGGHQAIRNDDGTFAFTVADHHGTGQLAVRASDLSVSQRRMLPFGGIRGTTPTSWPGTKGFVGGTDDTKDTGLTHLGAREYDPAIGRFISVDPIMDLTDPQQIHGYTYANNNPLAFSDPTGLRPEGVCGGNSSACMSAASSRNGTATTYNESWTRKKGAWYWQSYEENKKGERFYTTACLGCGRWADLTSPKLHWTDFFALHAELAPKWSAVSHAVLGIEAAFRGDRQEAGDRALSAAPVVGDIKFLKKLLELGKSKCRNSFVPGTKVLMADGSAKPIEDVKIGDEVLATDPETGETRAETVTAEIIGSGVKHLVKVTIDIDGEAGSKTATVTATDNHPFWVPELGEWLDATDLKSGQWLQTSAGTHVQITAIQRWTAQSATVHNLTVSNLHTYYVLAGKTPVLVHNTNCEFDPEFPSIKLDNYRGRFNAWLGKNGYKRLPKDWDAHHAIPQEYRDHPEFRDFDFDAPSNIRGVPGSRMKSRGANVHQDITNQWKWFRDMNPNPTRAQIEDFARQIDRGYGAYFWGEPK